MQELTTAFNNATNTNEIKIAQLNADRGYKVDAEIRNKVEMYKIDILILQEPYSIRNKLQNFGQGVGSITGNKENEMPWAAIVVFNRNLTIMRLGHLCDSHVVCIQVDNGAYSFYIVNAYFQFSHDINRYIRKLKNILSVLRGKRVVLALDANAKSALWHFGIGDERGLILEEFIAEESLVVVNEESENYTYSSTRGQSNIDVTLTTENLTNMLRDWKVTDKWTSSDHNTITFSIVNTHFSRERINVNRWCTNKADWNKFQSFLQLNMGEVRLKCDSRRDVIDMAKEIRVLISKACRQSMPYRKKGKIGTKWWTAELTSTKKGVYRARRRCQREKNADVKADLRKTYLIVKRNYDKLIEKTRKAKFEEFLNKNANDAWGYAYKISCDKLRTTAVMESFAMEAGHTIDWKDTAEGLLDHLFGYDDMIDEEDFHLELREQMMIRLTSENASMFTQFEIKKVIKKMKLNIAPGWDKLDLKIIREAFEVMAPLFEIMFNGCLTFGLFPNE